MTINRRILRPAFGGVIIVFALCQIRAAARDGADDFARAVRQYYSGEPAACLETMRGLAAEFPNNADYRRNLIQLLKENGDYQSALAQLQELSRIEPGPGLRAEMLQTTFLAGRWEETVRLSAAADLNAEELFWRGLALAELGRDAEAVKALTDCLAKDSFNPTAYYWLGRLAQKKGDCELAVSYYKKAAAQEPSMPSIYFPLAQAHLALGNFVTARNLLVNAKASYPWDAEITGALKRLDAEHPEITQRQEEEAQRKRQVLIPPMVVPAADRDEIPMIRIGLVEKTSRFFLKTGDRFRLTAPGKGGYEGEGCTVLCVTRTGGKMEFRDERGGLLFTAVGDARLSYDNPAAATVLFDVEYGQGTYWAGREDRVYRGEFQFLAKSSGITIVNRVNMEEYLYGVVPWEMQASWPGEALKSQAVAARTYAFANMRAYESRGFDLLAAVASQVYRGVRGERPATNAAVDATRGCVLRYNGRPIAAVYSGNNGGYTTSSLDIWRLDLPYLQAVPDKSLAQTGPFSPADLAVWLTGRPQTFSNNPRYSARSHFRWTAWVSRSDLEHRLKLGAKLGRILSLTVMQRSANGAAVKVVVKGEAGGYTVTGDAIRGKLGGLRSNVFVVQPRLGADGGVAGFVFYGGGWGHGVGMCQSGAAGMAAAGYQFAEILGHYYPGTELAELY